MIPFLIYVAIFVVAFFLVTKIAQRTAISDYGSLKTVTFGDESAVTPNRAASIISVLTIFLLWGMFTGSSLLPSFLHAPGPFQGTGTFEYTATTDGDSDTATVTVVVHPIDVETDAPEVAPGDGWAKDDSVAIGMWRSGLLRVDRNDELGRDAGAVVTAINGTAVEPGDSVNVGFGTVTISDKGTPNITPAKGWQMEPIWLPSPEAVVVRIGEIASEGFRGSTLWEHLGYSLFRVVVGFFFGALVGIPLGYAMGLSNWFRGWFDPIVEFMQIGRASCRERV